MDNDRFDTATKFLFSQLNRRRTLSGFLGAALATRGALGTPGPVAVAARKGKSKGKRNEKKRWCHCPNSGDLSQCVTLNLKRNARQRHRDEHPFDSPGPCQPFSCPAGQTNCTGVCKNLQTDETNCGACGTTCGALQGCCNGVCQSLNTDEANCGTCGNACAVGQTCCAGVCVNTDTHPANCGSCGNVCVAPDVLCLAGNCCRPPNQVCAIGADCCSNVCLAANMVIPFPHCA